VETSASSITLTHPTEAVLDSGMAAVKAMATDLRQRLNVRTLVRNTPDNMFAYFPRAPALAKSSPRSGTLMPIATDAKNSNTADATEPIIALTVLKSARAHVRLAKACVSQKSNGDKSD